MARMSHTGIAGRAGVIASLLCAASLASADDAGTPLTPDEFDAYVTGHTMFYNSGNTPYGAEQYLPGRKVVWAFTGDDCLKGEWHPDGAFVCFTYEDKSGEQCWTFYRSADGLSARFKGDPAGTPLVAVRQSPAPMACMGPDVGV